MPRTRNKPKKPTSKPAPVGTNGPPAPSGEVFNLAEAAAYLRVSEEEILRLMREQDFPGRMVGPEWRFLKPAIQNWLSTSAKRGSREAVLSTIGSLAGDPCLEEEVKEIYRKRREHLVGDDQ